MLGRNFAQVNGFLESGFGRETLHPEAQSFLGPRHREENDRLESPSECFVQVLALVGGKYCNPVEGLNALQEKRDFLLGVAVVSILASLRFPQRASASSEKCIQPLCWAWSKTWGRVFSVAPMYFEMTRERSML